METPPLAFEELPDERVWKELQGQVLRVTEGIFKEDFWPGALDACGDHDGRLLGIPLMINISGIYFNEEVLTLVDEQEDQFALTSFETLEVTPFLIGLCT